SVAQARVSRLIATCAKGDKEQLYLARRRELYSRGVPLVAASIGGCGGQQLRKTAYAVGPIGVVAVLPGEGGRANSPHRSRGPLRIDPPFVAGAEHQAAADGYAPSIVVARFFRPPSVQHRECGTELHMKGPGGTPNGFGAKIPIRKWPYECERIGLTELRRHPITILL